jgi:hypothetical protein
VDSVEDVCKVLRSSNPGDTIRVTGYQPPSEGSRGGHFTVRIKLK